MGSPADDTKVRNDRILERRKAGKTLREIATEFRLSHEGIRQILASNGFSDPTVARVAQKSARSARDLEAIEFFDREYGRVVERLLALDVVPAEVVGRLVALGHNVTEDQVRDFAGRHGLPVSKPMPLRFARQIVRLAILAAAAEAAGLDADPSDAVLLEATELNGLRDACDTSGEFETAAALIAAARSAGGSLSITKDRYEEWRGAWIQRYHKAGAYPWPPTHQTMMKQSGQGTWNDAIQDAGLTPNTRGRTRGHVFYTQERAYEDAAAAFVEAMASRGKQSSTSEYERWARGQPVPSEAAMRTYFRSWGALVRTGLAESGLSGFKRGVVRRANKADRLVDDQLFELRRHVDQAEAALLTEGTKAEAAFQLKLTVEDLVSESVTSFESFRRQWIVAAAGEDTSAFVANVAPGGQADSKERKIWLALQDASLADAVPLVIDDRLLDRLTGVPTGSVRNAGGWLAREQQGRLDSISEADVRRFRILKAVRNVIEHESENSIRVLSVVLGELAGGEDAALLDGSSRLTSKDLVVRWLAAKSGAPATSEGARTIASTRLGSLLDSLEQIVSTMRSDAAGRSTATHTS